jgi:hypothetical protein
MVNLRRALVPTVLQSTMSPLRNVDRGVGGVMRKWLLPVLLASLLVFMLVQVAAADDTTETLTTRFSAVGRYGIVAAGVGMRDSPSGDIVLNVPGQEIVAAYLYWAGHDDLGVDPTGMLPVGGGDNTVGLDRDSSGTPIMLTANAAHTYGPSYWLGTSWRFVYWQDVTSHVRNGLHTYTVSGFGPGMTVRDGAGLVVVYRDPALPLSKVEIKDGLDRAYRNWTEDLDPVDGNADSTGPRGESAVNCFGFEAASTSRQMDLIIMLSGLDSTGEFGDRPSSVWYRTGTVATPVDMLNADVDWDRAPNVLLLDRIPTGPGDYPFSSNSGDEWDTYANSIGVPGGRTWACFQIESSELPATAPGDPVLGLCPAAGCRAASIATIVTAGAVRVAPPPDEPAETVVPEAGTLALLGSGLAGLAGYATLRWRSRE